MKPGAPPPGGALFPIVPTPASGPVPAAAQPRPPAPADQAAATPTPQAGAMSAELDLLWKDEEFSMGSVISMAHGPWVIV
ncbi:hypothetical protein BSKO_02822 [Bryopsis sp. KO-2023]|nr:hypothetical protein BSKO_02822 [Bryopsis sp. KO-2023]